MSAAAEQTIRVRQSAANWVAREERRTGSRMTAYDIVASTVGVSPDWLRKFIKGNEAKQPRWDIGWNIIAHYERICERVEAANEAKRAILARREEQGNAAAESACRVAEPDLPLLVEARAIPQEAAPAAVAADPLEIPAFLVRPLPKRGAE